MIHLIPPCFVLQVQAAYCLMLSPYPSWLSKLLLRYMVTLLILFGERRRGGFRTESIHLHSALLGRRAAAFRLMAFRCVLGAQGRSTTRSTWLGPRARAGRAARGAPGPRRTAG